MYMNASIISRYTLTLLDTVTVSNYEISLDGEFDGRSQIVLHRKPAAEEDDFILLHDGGIVFQGIIDNIENARSWKPFNFDIDGYVSITGYKCV
jgi:hypothetical protein